MAKTASKVVVEATKFRNMRYFHTNFPIANNRGMAEEINADRATNYVSQGLGIKGTELVAKIGETCQDLGLRKIQISAYMLTIEKYEAFSWKDLEAQVIKAINAVLFPSPTSKPNVSSLDGRTAWVRMTD